MSNRQLSCLTWVSESYQPPLPRGLLSTAYLYHRMGTALASLWLDYLIDTERKKTATDNPVLRTLTCLLSEARRRYKISRHSNWPDRKKGIICLEKSLSNEIHQKRKSLWLRNSRVQLVQSNIGTAGTSDNSFIPNFVIPDNADILSILWAKAKISPIHEIEQSYIGSGSNAMQIQYLALRIIRAWKTKPSWKMTQKSVKQFSNAIRDNDWWIQQTYQIAERESVTKNSCLRYSKPFQYTTHSIKRYRQLPML